MSSPGPAHSASPPSAVRHLPAGSSRSASALGIAAPPLAHASGGAPVWAIVVAIVVVAVALLMLFGPSDWLRPSKPTEPLAADSQPLGVNPDAGEES